MILPPGVSAGAFARALKEFEAAIGKQWVFASDEDVALYRDAYSIYWGEKEERQASAAVAPITVEEVQAIVRIANKYKLPLYPISTGRNLTYGGSAPNHTGSVVVDLKRMNKVLEVDDKRHFALVEPGVSYFDLYRHIQERGLKVFMDIPDPGWGSPVGNSLDRGIGYTMAQFRDHWGAHCGMEVVLPTGEVLRTGMGALPGSHTWQDYKEGIGPSVDGLFAQSNFGIVTKMGFWLMPQPDNYLSGRVSVPRYLDIIPLIEQVAYLENSGLCGLPQYLSPHRVAFGQPLTPALAELVRGGWPSQEKIDAFVTASGVPPWGVGLQFYGPEETVRANWAYAKKRIAAAIPGATFNDGPLLTMPLTAEQAEKVNKTAFGIPALTVFSMVVRQPHNDADPPTGHADFIVVLPRDGRAVIESARVMGETYMELGLEPQSTPFNAPLGWPSRALFTSCVIYTYRDPEKNRKMRELFSRLIDRCAEHGWGDYRTAPAFQDQLVGKYSFNDHALLRFQERLKDAADPNGIIAPGRYGIWPKHLRSKRA